MEWKDFSIFGDFESTTSAIEGVLHTAQGQALTPVPVPGVRAIPLTLRHVAYEEAGAVAGGGGAGHAMAADTVGVGDGITASLWPCSREGQISLLLGVARYDILVPVVTPGTREMSAAISRSYARQLLSSCHLARQQGAVADEVCGEDAPASLVQVYEPSRGTVIGVHVTKHASPGVAPPPLSTARLKMDTLVPGEGAVEYRHAADVVTLFAFKLRALGVAPAPVPRPMPWRVSCDRGAGCPLAALTVAYAIQPRLRWWWCVDLGSLTPHAAAGVCMPRYVSTLSVVVEVVDGGAAHGLLCRPSGMDPLLPLKALHQATTHVTVQPFWTPGSSTHRVAASTTGNHAPPASSTCWSGLREVDCVAPLSSPSPPPTTIQSATAAPCPFDMAVAHAPWPAVVALNVAWAQEVVAGAVAMERSMQAVPTTLTWTNAPDVEATTPSHLLPSTTAAGGAGMDGVDGQAAMRTFRAFIASPAFALVQQLWQGGGGQADKAVSAPGGGCSRPLGTGSLAPPPRTITNPTPGRLAHLHARAIHTLAYMHHIPDGAAALKGMVAAVMHGDEPEPMGGSGSVGDDRRLPWCWQSLLHAHLRRALGRCRVEGAHPSCHGSGRGVLACSAFVSSVHMALAAGVGHWIRVHPLLRWLVKASHQECVAREQGGIVNPASDDDDAGSEEEGGVDVAEVEVAGLEEVGSTGGWQDEGGGGGCALPVHTAALLHVLHHVSGAVAADVAGWLGAQRDALLLAENAAGSGVVSSVTRTGAWMADVAATLALAGCVHDGMGATDPLSLLSACVGHLHAHQAGSVSFAPSNPCSSPSPPITAPHGGAGAAEVGEGAEEDAGDGWVDASDGEVVEHVSAGPCDAALCLPPQLHAILPATPAMAAMDAQRQAALGILRPHQVLTSAVAMRCRPSTTPVTPATSQSGAVAATALDAAAVAAGGSPLPSIAIIRSDMAAFRHCNPAAQLSTFLSWYLAPPSLPVAHGVHDVSQAALWRELWSHTHPRPIRHQASPLSFSTVTEACLEEAGGMTWLNTARVCIEAMGGGKASPTITPASPALALWLPLAQGWDGFMQRAREASLTAFAALSLGGGAEGASGDDAGWGGNNGGGWACWCAAAGRHTMVAAGCEGGALGATPASPPLYPWNRGWLAHSWAAGFHHVSLSTWGTPTGYRCPSHHDRHATASTRASGVGASWWTPLLTEQPAIVLHQHGSGKGDATTRPTMHPAWAADARGGCYDALPTVSAVRALSVAAPIMPAAAASMPSLFSTAHPHAHITDVFLPMYASDAVTAAALLARGEAVIHLDFPAPQWVDGGYDRDGASQDGEGSADVDGDGGTERGDGSSVERHAISAGVRACPVAWLELMSVPGGTVGYVPHEAGVPTPLPHGPGRSVLAALLADVRLDAGGNDGGAGHLPVSPSAFTRPAWQRAVFLKQGGSGTSTAGAPPLSTMAVCVQDDGGSVMMAQSLVDGALTPMPGMGVVACHAVT